MVCDRNPAAWDTPESSVSSVKRITARRFLQFFRGAERTSPEDLLHAARVLLWVRWFGLTAAFVEIHYRVDYGSLSHVLNTFYCLGFLAANGYVQWLIRRRGTVKPVVAVCTECPGPGGDLVQHFPFGWFRQSLLRVVLFRGGGVRLCVHLPTPRPAVDDAGGRHLLGAERCG